MKCDDIRRLLDGYVDGELDLVNHLQIEKHLENCRDCARGLESLSVLRTALTDDSFYFRAPRDLSERARLAVREAGSATVNQRYWRSWFPTLATAAVLAAILISGFIFLRSSATSEDFLANEIVSAHIRSMMVSHLTDVPSSDQHTVKPWFDGKLDYSPPVVDLASQGFALVGGRLDYAGSRPIGALVYQRRQHIINLFVFPTQDSSDTANKMLARQGYNVIHWTRSGMTFWAVSDLNLNELQELAQMLQN